MIATKATTRKWSGHNGGGGYTKNKQARKEKGTLSTDSRAWRGSHPSKLMSLLREMSSNPSLKRFSFD